MRIISVAVFILLPSWCLAQQKEIDSLLTVLKNHPAEDTTRIILLNDISYDYYQLDPDKGIDFANQAIALSEKIKSEPGLGVSLARKGLNYAEKGEYATALDHYKKAAAIFEKIRDEKKLFSVSNSTAIVHMRMSEFPKALELYFKNLRLAEKGGKQKDIAICAGNIALVYARMQNHQQALVYNGRAIDIQRKANDEKALADLLNSRGNFFDSKGEPTNAILLYKESLLLSKKLDYIKGVASANANLSNIFDELGMPDSAFRYAKNSLEFYQQIGDKTNMAVLLEYLGNIVTKADNNTLMKEGIQPAERHRVAIDYFQQSLSLTTEMEDVAAQAESWQSISNSYKQLKQFDKALEAQEQYVKLRDSILSDEKMEAVKQSELQYAVKKNEDSLSLIQEKKDLEVIAEINRQNTIKKAVSWGAAILLAAALVSFIFYKKRRDARQKQQEAEFKTEVADTEMKALRAQMNPHFIFNSLNSISDYIAKNDTAQADKYLSKFAKLMRMILENSEQKEVPLSEDLKALELYMKLEALRMKS
ncbi:MAG: tetratricopeptide repeat protein [Chitinophagaceae bacterium]|nr:tetratricopeptide repeat protein [Chitinophagaceae bacterium]